MSGLKHHKIDNHTESNKGESIRTLPIRLTILACVSVIMLGCATVGKDFSSEGVRRLSVGNTTEKEILEAFGKPLMRQDRSVDNIQYQLLTYAYAKGTPNSSKGRELFFEFVNGVLNAYIFYSSLEGDSTDFNIDTASKLNEKPLNVNDVITLMGRQNGEVRFPSILLKRIFGSMPEIVPPPGASIAILYFYSEAKRESNLLNNHVKLFIVYATSDGTVIETRYFKGIL